MAGPLKLSCRIIGYISFPLLLVPVIFPLASCQKAAKPSVLIGTVLPLTGDAATFGKNALQGATLAIEEWPETPGQPIFTLKSEDSRGNPAEAASAARALIDTAHARMLIGDVTSAGTHAMIPIVTSSQVPLVSPAASDPALSGTSAFFARVWPSDVFEARVIGGYANREGYASIGIILANTDYGLAMADEFIRQVSKEKISLKIPVDRETQNYRPTIERLRASGVDSLFLILYPEDARRFLQQMAEVNFAPPMLATATFEDPSLAAHPGAARVVFASPVPPESSAAREAFAKKYRDRFGEDPGVLSDTGFDAANILMTAYQKRGDQGAAAVMDFITNLKDYPGVSGTMSFDRQGDVTKEYGLKTVRDGEFVWLEP